MARADANGIQLEYQTFGTQGPALVLIMGFGAQMLGWDERFCEQLSRRGCRVIRFDNRDVGLSSRVSAGAPGELAYSLDDMAGDVAGLLDALGIAAAHIVGMSLGGIIAQLVAVHHPDKVLSLCSIASSCGPDVGRARPGMFRAMLGGQAATRDEAVAHAVVTAELFAGPAFPVDADAVRERAARLWDRDHDDQARSRQWEALRQAGDRTGALGAVRSPALVIHGADDPLVDVSGGQATAAAIPGARLLVIDGMGHELPQGAWETVIDAIATNAGIRAAP